MIRRKKLTAKQARKALSTGDFGRDVIASQKAVAIILTQSWCPESGLLRRSLDSLDPDQYDIDIYELEYDREPYFAEFLRFKEDELGNRLIPYVRYYVDGEFVGETNYVSVKTFLAHFNLR